MLFVSSRQTIQICTLVNWRMWWNHTWHKFLHCGRVCADRLPSHSSEYFGLWLLRQQHTAPWSQSVVHGCIQWSRRHWHCCGGALREMELHPETWGRTPSKHMLTKKMFISICNWSFYITLLFFWTYAIKCYILYSLQCKDVSLNMTLSS